MSAVAVAVALAGVTPAEAVRAVKRALNADAVDGFSASKTPRPGPLLALDGNGRFPASTLPPGPRGPRGPGGAAGPAGSDGVRGPAGATGPRGPSSAFVDREFGPFNLNGTNVKQKIVEVRVPAGNYQIQFSSHVYLGSGIGVVDCDFERDGTPIDRTTVVVGNHAGGVIEAPVAMTDVASSTAAMTVNVRCAQRSPVGAQLIEPRLVAISVDAITEQ